MALTRWDVRQLLEFLTPYYYEGAANDIFASKNGGEGVPEGTVQVEIKDMFSGAQMDQPLRGRCDRRWDSRRQCEMTLRFKCKCSFNCPLPSHTCTHILATHMHVNHTHIHTLALGKIEESRWEKSLERISLHSYYLSGIGTQERDWFLKQIKLYF